MLQFTNGSIVESLSDKAAQANLAQRNMMMAMGQGEQAIANSCVTLGNSNGGLGGGYTIGGGYNCYPYQTQWYSYPVYVCSDKTAKAIEILKALQADKILEVKSVPKFIELVEKISGIL